MLIPVGLKPFADAHPDRIVDVGIAEQHGATSAAGMALAGLHPVMAVYATFLNRAFDQVLMDVALHRAGVTFVLDRAGATGDDGASHNGMWDMSILQVVPGLRLAAPRDEATLRAELREALDVHHAPTVVRFPKGALPAAVPAVGRHGVADVLRQPRTADPDVLVVAVGAMAGTCLDAAARLDAHGLDSTVVDPRWVKPVDPSLVELARRHRVVAVVEDGGRVGGVVRRGAPGPRRRRRGLRGRGLRHRAGVPRAHAAGCAPGPQRPHPPGHQPARGRGRHPDRGSGRRARRRGAGRGRVSGGAGAGRGSGRPGRRGPRPGRRLRPAARRRRPR